MKLINLKTIVFSFLIAICFLGNAQNNRNDGGVGEELRQIWEQFCNEQYNYCFRPKLYINGSLTVVSYGPVSNGIIPVSGYHSYKGEDMPFIGRKTHSNVKYRADIQTGKDMANVRFFRWSEPDITDINGHWESCGFITVHRKISVTLSLMSFM